MKNKMAFIIATILLIVFAVLNICFGAVSISGSQFLEILRSLFDPSLIVSGSDMEGLANVVFQIRLPRVVATILVGAALSMSGSLMQGLFKNPLAGPDVLGVSAGSSLGAVISIIFAGSASLWLSPILAICGGLGAAFVIYIISHGAKSAILLHIVLAGLAISSFLAAIVSAILLFANTYQINTFIFWTMGGLEGRTWLDSLRVLPMIVLTIILSFFMAKRLNLLMLGDQSAHSSGINIARTKIFILILSAILTAMAISIAGPIGFIGLIVPHMARLIVGQDFRKILPFSVILGPLVLLFADFLGRNLASPYEIRVGIVTAFIGSPYFIWLVIRARKKAML